MAGRLQRQIPLLEQQRLDAQPLLVLGCQKLNENISAHDMACIRRILHENTAISSRLRALTRRLAPQPRIQYCIGRRNAVKVVRGLERLLRHVHRAVVQDTARQTIAARRVRPTVARATIARQLFHAAKVAPRRRYDKRPIASRINRL